jgi:16S rRNA (cytidine1402-2'-O)-methyltransferase
MGNLYIVATPIGNLQDISLRAIDTLLTVKNIFCEDTRKTGALIEKIKTYKIESDFSHPSLYSYFEGNEMARLPFALELLQSGDDIALVSDAGTPTISDPGYKLVREALKIGVKVISIPGPSSVISALVSSGFPTDKFLFLGFLPKKEGHRRELLEKSKKSNDLIEASIIIFESPFRINKTLSELQEIFGDVNIAVCRELTKIYEEVKRGKISEVSTYFANKKPKGEFVIVLNSKD